MNNLQLINQSPPYEKQTSKNSVAILDKMSAVFSTTIPLPLQTYKTKLNELVWKCWKNRKMLQNCVHSDINIPSSLYFKQVKRPVTCCDLQGSVKNNFWINAMILFTPLNCTNKEKKKH